MGYKVKKLILCFHNSLIYLWDTISEPLLIFFIFINPAIAFYGYLALIIIGYNPEQLEWVVYFIAPGLLSLGFFLFTPFILAGVLWEMLILWCKDA